MRLTFPGGEPGIREVGIAGLTAARPDGLPLVPAPDEDEDEPTAAVEETGAAPTLWGLVIAVADLDAAKVRLGDLLGAPRAAVQPGRRIATVRREAGLGTALALMSPRY